MNKQKIQNEGNLFFLIRYFSSVNQLIVYSFSFVFSLLLVANAKANPLDFFGFLIDIKKPHAIVAQHVTHPLFAGEVIGWNLGPTLRHN